jgi:hypothetical protein
MFGMLLVLLAQVEPVAKPPPAAAATPRTRAILARLEEPIVMELEVPLDSVLEGIKRASKKGPNDPGIPIYVDPLGLQRAERSLNSLVKITPKATPPKETLERALTSMRMAYIVKDDVLIISDPRGIERERNEVGIRACDASPATRALLARLEEPVKMPFPHEIPLGDALEHIKRATARPPGGRGIEILVVPDGLNEAKRSLNSTIQVDLEGVPLKTTLRLLLDQLGMACAVKEGRLIIHSHEGIRKLLRNAQPIPPAR